jgi:UDP-glucose 4-epimerase
MRIKNELFPDWCASLMGDPVVNQSLPRRVLITGAAGFLGSHLAEQYLARGVEVLALDTRSMAPLEGRPNATLFNDSLLNEELVRQLVAQVDTVFHLGAVVGLQNVIGQLLQVVEVNVQGTKHVLRAAAEHQRRVLFASTSEIAGKSPRLPFGEDDDRLLGPISRDRWVYTETKALGEYMCSGYAREGLPISVVRLFNVYGPRLDPEGSGRVISRFIRQILDGGPATVIGSGQQTRCFTFVDDVIRGVVTAGEDERAIGGTYNLGSNEEVSILDLLRVLFKVMETEVEVSFIDPQELYGPGYEDIPRRIPDVSRASRDLGFRAETPLEVGLARTVDWFRSGDV